MQGGSLLIMLVLMVGLMYFMSRSQKKQYQKRMESLNKLQKGNEVITIGGLYGTIDEVDTDRKTVVLDVDGVYLTFELGAIKTVLPVSEGISATATEGASSDAGSKKRPESLFYGDLWYNEAINIEIGRKTCFVLRKKKKSRYL